MKRSFFDKLSGSVNVGDNFDDFEDAPIKKGSPISGPRPLLHKEDAMSSSAEGQLPVDVHQTPNEIVIRAFVAGVRPDELSISISRDMVVLEGSRMERDSVSDVDFFTRELFWGTFSRTILLPQEIDVDNAAASSKDGLLTIVLPKLDKARQTKLRVKAG